MDRAGRIERVSVGDARRVGVPRQPSAPAGRRRFCTLRFLATRLSDEQLGAEELAPLGLHRLDALAVVAVAPDGAPGPVRVAHLLPAPLGPVDGNGDRVAPAEARLPRGAVVPRRGNGARRGDDVQDVLADGERYRLFPPREAGRVDDDFLELIRALESEFERHFERTRVAGKVGRAILLHVTTGRRALAEASMDELVELAASANLQVVERVVQRRQAFDPHTLVGAGKLQDLIIHAQRLGAEFVVVDQNLTPAQARAIAEASDLKVIDRSQLILDIFASRAHTHEGKLQVELAQLKYLLPRLMGRGDTGLSRLEGGIGGRGPGEQKLEVDRRRVRDRISRLERELKVGGRRRQQRRARRLEREVPVVSLVGYTNAGKSTLLNLLTRSEVVVEARMFATLDPTSRRLRLPREREVVINDTVGFIRDLPPDLLAAFRATLEEIRGSHLIVHLVDASHPGREAQIRAVETILGELECDTLPRLVVLNKIDAVDPAELEDLLAVHPQALAISALESLGLDGLLRAIDEALPLDRRATPESALESRTSA